MLKLFRSSYIEKMLFCETVVPATVPSGEPIGISLPSSRKRGAGECLHVNVSFRIGVCSEVSLCLSVRIRHHNKCRCSHQHFPHAVAPCLASMKPLTLCRCVAG